MLLIVSSVSVIFNLPSYIMRIKAYLIEVIRAFIFFHMAKLFRFFVSITLSFEKQDTYSVIFFRQTDERNFMATNTTIIIQTISWFLFITNFGINFVLYCLSGQNFRYVGCDSIRIFTSKQHLRLYLRMFALSLQSLVRLNE